MVFLINRPMKRSGSSREYFRKRVPANVLAIARGKQYVVMLPTDHQGSDHIRVKFTLGTDIRFSLRARAGALARLRNAAATEQIERLFAELSAGPPPPQPLSRKQIVAIAGVVYRAFAKTLEEDPRLSADQWREIELSQREDLDGYSPILALYLTTADREAARLAQRDQALERRYGRTVDALLAKYRLVVDAQTRSKVVREVAKVAPEASAKLARNAEGDYSPDQYSERFPPVDECLDRPKAICAGLSFTDLQMRWEREGPKARRTRSANKSAVCSFEKHLGHSDAARVRRADVLAWKDALLAAGLSAKTINDGYLAHIRILFRVAKRNDLLAADPSEGIRVPSKAKAGARRLPYTDAEVATLLALADRETSPRLRWMPWLLALTGARAGEIAQLWGAHVRVRDGIHYLCITPTDDGGEIKNAVSEREVPLHVEIIARGFLDFVATRNGGPLFYGGANASPRPPKPGAMSHAAKSAINRVREWVREQEGFNNPRKAPNHAFRHWFKTACMRAGVLDSVANALQGHVGSDGEAGTYRHFDLKTLHDAVCRVRLPAQASPTYGDASSEVPAFLRTS